MPTRKAKEARRARGGPRLKSTRNGGVCTTGHPALFAIAPAFELGIQPEGGGFPIGLVEYAARLMDCRDLSRIVHLCSGSVRAPLTFDLRPESEAACLADVRWLPVRPGSVRWIVADPPYGADYAQELWGTGKQYPTPTVLLRECLEALEPGGQVALLHQVIPQMPDGLESLGVWGVYCGTNTRMRALTIGRKSERL